MAGDPCTYGSFTATDDCDAEHLCWDVENVDGVDIGVCTALCGGSANNPTCSPNTSCVLLGAASVPLCLSTCDPLLQDCAEGEGCYWDLNDSTFACFPTAENIPLNEPCGFTNDCAPGMMCITAEVLPDCAGAACCGSFCDLADPACPAPGTKCSAFFEMNMAPPGYQNIGVCIIPGA